MPPKEPTMAERQRFLSEGMCPYHCGPMIRYGHDRAHCPRCRYEFISDRVKVIFPDITREIDS